MRRVFSSALKHGPVAPDVLRGRARRQRAIDSDYELAELASGCEAPAAQCAHARAVPKAQPHWSGAIMNAAESRRAVELRRTPARAHSRRCSTHHWRSTADYEQASFLIDVAKSQSIDGALRAPFFKGVETLSSSFERGRLQAVVKSGTSAGHARRRAPLDRIDDERSRGVGERC